MLERVGNYVSIAVRRGAGHFAASCVTTPRRGASAPKHVRRVRQLQRALVVLQRERLRLASHHGSGMGAKKDKDEGGNQTKPSWLCAKCSKPGRPVSNFGSRKECRQCGVSKGSCFLCNDPTDTLAKEDAKVDTPRVPGLPPNKDKKPRKRGKKQGKPSPKDDELAQLRKENAELKKQKEKADQTPTAAAPSPAKDAEGGYWRELRCDVDRKER